MTNTEKQALIGCVNAIRHYASLETAMFDIDKEKDEIIKNKILPYMCWFDAVATQIEDIVSLSDENDRSLKKYNLEKIITSNVIFGDK